jgi:geranylgeranyl pyrophosphate synthase
LLENGNEGDKQVISDAIKSQSTKHLKTIQKRINETPALKYTQEKANEFASLAKQQLVDLPESNAKNALLFLCNFACHRNN